MSAKTKTMKVKAGHAGSPRHAAEEYVPLVDVYETGDSDFSGTVVVAEVPGATEDSIDIRVEKGVLSISAEAALEEPGDQYSRTYTGFVGGRYFRAFALSDEVDRENIQASLADGVLTVRLPHGAAAETHKIKIKSE